MNESIIRFLKGEIYRLEAGVRERNEIIDRAAKEILDNKALNVRDLDKVYELNCIVSELNEEGNDE
jgi:hypothetical protein